MPSKLELVLYVSSGSMPSRRALANLMRIVQLYDPADLEWSVRNVTNQPLAPDEEPVFLTPTLVLRGALTGHVVGDLRDPFEVTDLLHAAGVRQVPNPGGRRSHGS